MKDHPPQADRNPPADTAIDLFEVEQLIVGIACHTRNSLHDMWFSDTDRESASAGLYLQAAAALVGGKRFTLTVLDENILVENHILHRTMVEDGHVVGHVADQLRFFAGHLTSLGINNFTVEDGITREDFDKLVDILDAKEFEIEQLGGFEKLLSDFSVGHVKAEKMHMAAVLEDEVVVHKTRAGGPRVKKSAVTEECVGNILAFLKGDLTAGPGKDVDKAVNDPAKLAELILQAASVQQQAVPIENGETITDFVVGCLKRTYEHVLGGKAPRTPTGRKRLTKNLMLLEEEILARMRALTEEWDEDDLQQISEAVQGATDEIRMDLLTEEYVDLQEQESAKAKEILSIARAVDDGQGGEALLKQKFLGHGLKEHDWQALLLKGQAGAAPGFGSGGSDGGGDMFQAIEHLEVLLGRMDGHLQERGAVSDVDANTLAETIRGVSMQITNLTSQLNAVVTLLTSDAHADRAQVEQLELQAMDSGMELNTSRSGLLSRITGVFSELAPALILLTTSMTGLTAGTMGTLNSQQRACVTLLSESIEQIGTLLRRLERLSL